jgi:CO dehydrogenase/acetyl-CoA synthase beta subunit
MDRGYGGEAPGGLTWSLLANRAGGKQSLGVTGISLAYLQGPRAFAGEGGLAAVKWATKRCLAAMQTAPRLQLRVATEDDATTLAQLRDFVSRK